MSFKEYASKNYVLEKLASLGSPVTSWNDLTDKPFGRGDVLYRFGQEDIIETIGRFAKINNEPANYEETFLRRTYILYSEGGSVLQTGQIFNQFTFPDYPGVYAVEIEIGGVSSSIYVVAEDNTELFGSTLSKGIWVNSSFVDPAEYGIYLTEIIDLDKTIDEKYIPDTIARVTDILTSWNDLADKPFGDGRKIYEWVAGKEYPTVGESVKLSNDTPDKSAFIGGKIGIEAIFEGETMYQEMPIEEEGIYELAPGAFVVMEAIIVVTADSFENNGTLTKGIWTVDFSQLGAPFVRVSITINGSLKTIEDKFIPDTIARIKDVESMLGQVVYVEWDVNNEYEIAPDPAGDALVKLSDEVPNSADLIGASMSIIYEMDGEIKTETADFPPDYITTTDYGYVLGSVENPAFYFITVESAVVAETTLTRGIWTQNLAKVQGYLNFKIYKNPVIPKIFTAQVGQTIVVKAVDENGRPVEWEAVDLPTGGAGSGLPPVTEADNGKVLTVVNGVWTAVALPNAEEASF